MNIDLDKILETGAQLADSAKKTATDLAQKGKKQVDLMNAQTRLSKAQRQLGALVYSLEKNGEKNELLVKKYVDAISTIEEEIETLKKQESQIQTQRLHQREAPGQRIHLHCTRSGAGQENLPPVRRGGRRGCPVLFLLWGTALRSETQA